jgi:Na+/H+ antiporter NhaD/arsenite permease-like protein
MSLAVISLTALIIVLLVSCTTSLNVGVLALAAAWIVGVYLGGMRLEDVLGTFPIQLFLTLVGVTLLFTQAQLNGTLEKVAHASVRVCRGNVGFIPIMFFLLGCGIGSLGPGNVAMAAMLAPMAMAVAARARIPAFLMAIMVGNGAQASALSPFAPTGIIVNGLMMKIGLGGHEWWNYWTNLVAHTMVAFGGYLVLGGLQLFKREYSGEPTAAADATAVDRGNWITIGMILAVMAAVLFAGANIGMAAFAGAVILAALRVADHDQAIRKVPWTPIIMVSGVTVLVGLLEKTGGLDLFTALLARTATRDTITGMIAFVTGLISVYSSTSGVVLPAFLPTVPGLVTRLGAVDPLTVAASMNIGAHLVDMSPLSTTGAICIAGISDPDEVKRTYNKLLVWGLSMTVVGAIGCYVFL